MKNPLLEEANEIYVSSKEYLRVHIGYLVALLLFTVLLWPNASYMRYFRTETVPAAFRAVIIFQLLTAAGVSLYAGLDRLAEDRLIKYSEWLERTSVPVSVLLLGKSLSGILHTLFIVALGIPSIVIAAGPAGIPFGAVVSSEVIVMLTAIVCRMVGLTVSHLGEFRYVVRVVGGWLFVALYFVATVQIAPSLNPVVAVTRQHAENSPLMRPEMPVSFATHPLVVPGALILASAIAVFGVYALGLYRHRAKSVRARQSGNGATW